MNDSIKVIDKLKDILSQELGNKKIFDKDISKALDIKYDTFRKKKSRGDIPYFEIMSFLAKRNISINWFFFNQLPESLIESTSNYIILKYQRIVTASAGGGSINDLIDPKPLIVDKQLLDHINTNYSYTEVIKSLGDSMEPDIPNDSLVFIDKNDTYIKDKAVYLINTNNTLYIKRIEQRDNRYFMVSLNDIYNDEELNEFAVVGRVKGVLTKL